MASQKKKTHLYTKNADSMRIPLLSEILSQRVGHCVSDRNVGTATIRCCFKLKAQFRSLGTVQQICISSECSVYFSNRFCARCALDNKDEFPTEVSRDLAGLKRRDE